VQKLRQVQGKSSSCFLWFIEESPKIVDGGFVQGSSYCGVFLGIEHEGLIALLKFAKYFFNVCLELIDSAGSLSSVGNLTCEREKKLGLMTRSPKIR
jgi:hypothetical protein